MKIVRLIVIVNQLLNLTHKTSRFTQYRLNIVLFCHFIKKFDCNKGRQREGERERIDNEVARGADKSDAEHVNYVLISVKSILLAMMTSL